MTERRFDWMRGAPSRALQVALAALALGLLAGAALAAPGDHDPTFDGDGVKRIDQGGPQDGANDVLVQPDGKIVIVGQGGSAVDTDITVTRLNPDGTPDTGFDGDGTRRISLGDTDRANAVTLQPDGKIVVAGQTNVEERIVVVRLNPNGAPDAGFGASGVQTVEFGGADVGHEVMLQPDGKIIVAGHGLNTTDFVVARLTSNGTLDATFDTDGRQAIDFGGQEFSAGAALQPDGKVLVAGNTSVGANFAIARLNPNGTPDTTFDGDGKRTIDFNGTDGATGILAQPDGRLLISGFGGSTTAWIVTRLTATGSPDPGFVTDGDGNGSPGIDFGSGDTAQAAALQANGKIIVTGSGNAPANEAHVARLQPGGSLDTTFSTDGKQRLNVGSNASPQGVALQANGAVVIAGQVFAGASAPDAFMARLAGDPPASGGGPVGGGPGGFGVLPSVPKCAGEFATIVGTSGRDRLRGTRNADVIVTLGGNDTVKGGRGSDRICSGTGNDSVAGDSGNDRIYGQSGKDKIKGGTGNDALDGGASNDRISGQSGKDRIKGGSGNDTLDGGTSKDRIDGGKGRDRCVGGPGRDRAKCERKRGI